LNSLTLKPSFLTTKQRKKPSPKRKRRDKLKNGKSNVKNIEINTVTLKLMVNALK
jgi:hypothetical protein